MKILFSILFIFMIATLVPAESYLVNGGQESLFRYQLVQRVNPTPGMTKLYLSFVLPQSFQSPTYNQRISNLNIEFQPAPSSKNEYFDKRGNKILRAVWSNPRGPINSVLQLTASNQTKLNRLNTASPFPVQNLPPAVRDYLTATAEVQSDNPLIQTKARTLTDGAQNQFDAVQRILTWVIDHMRYVLTPQSYDALYAFRTGSGNCQNYSHLAAALMRSVGIPVRIVNGITLKRPYEIQTAHGTLTMKMAQGRHSWIEVYFNDLNWVPFDPQQTQLFVSNRFIRIEVGIDNQETRQDGLIRWSQVSQSYQRPQFEEAIEGEFQADRVLINGERQPFGPLKLLLTPPVATAFIPVQREPTPPPPLPPVSSKEIKQLRFQKKYLFGNLEFPKGIDFADVRGPVQVEQGNQFEMAKNFLVETAEYVTSQEQYAQVFVLKQPMQLQTISLALHKFGGNGMIWLELRQDENGIPGNRLATSQLIDVENMKFSVGYDWYAFDFTHESPVLAPGRYWMALGFSGSPIINWFYSYGKPVGPQDGTRYQTILAPNWSKSLAYEFNYRVEGLIAQ